MRNLSLPEILELHDMVIEISDGASGIRDMRVLNSPAKSALQTLAPFR